MPQGDAMPQKKLPAVFMRGGTSKGVLFHARDLPAREEWDSIFLSVIGSPDPNMRQLDGMGGGISSLSKVCVIGVAGTGAPIRLEFIEPGGAKTGKLLPTGKAVDQLEVAGTVPVTASLIDAANPCVFVPAVAVGATATEQPDEIDSHRELKVRLEAIRRAASVAMGIAADLDKAASISVPFVALVAPPAAMRVLSGRTLAAADMDIAVRMMSNGQAHRATPLTGALCLAVTTRIPGSIPNEMARRLAPGASQIRIGHASGVIVVDAQIDQPKNGHPHAQFAAVYRTARRLFEGRVHYRER